jgi:TPP-dependent pyruvate/acetoin dehydrogenase alpha subunit
LNHLTRRPEILKFSSKMSKEKKYSIKKTDKETLAKWFKLMLVGRAIDDRAPIT